MPHAKKTNGVTHSDNSLTLFSVGTCCLGLMLYDIFSCAPKDLQIEMSLVAVLTILGSSYIADKDENHAFKVAGRVAASALTFTAGGALTRFIADNDANSLLKVAGGVAAASALTNMAINFFSTSNRSTPKSAENKDHPPTTSQHEGKQYV